MTPTQYAALAAELAADPLGRGYAAMDAEQAAAALNLVDRTVRQLVPLWQVKKALIEWEVWPAVVAGQAAADPTKAGLCLLIVSYVDDPRFEHLDLDLESSKRLLGGAVLMGLITAEQSAFLDALATVPVSRATELGLEPIWPAQIRRVRSPADGTA